MWLNIIELYHQLFLMYSSELSKDLKTFAPMLFPTLEILIIQCLLCLPVPPNKYFEKNETWHAMRDFALGV